MIGTLRSEGWKCHASVRALYLGAFFFSVCHIPHLLVSYSRTCCYPVYVSFSIIGIMQMYALSLFRSLYLLRFREPKEILYHT